MFQSIVLKFDLKIKIEFGLGLVAIEVGFEYTEKQFLKKKEYIEKQ